MKRKSLSKQIRNALVAKTNFEGIDKHANKRSINNNQIVSSSTYQNYLDECFAFAKWVKATYPNNAVNTLEKLRPYASDYLFNAKKKDGTDYSPWTLKKRRAAIAKLYGVECRAICKLPIRCRKDIKRSRGISTMDASYNPDNHYEVELLGRAAGLRRADFSRVYPKDFYFNESGILFLHIDKGKGGKPREIMIDPDYAKDVLALIKDMPLNQRIIPLGCVPKKMDEHANRRAYAQAMYFRFARPISDIPKSERYYCRQDAKGLVLDRKAMAQVSLYLGHGSIDRKTGDYIPRVNVIASSYIL